MILLFLANPSVKRHLHFCRSIHITQWQFLATGAQAPGDLVSQSQTRLCVGDTADPDRFVIKGYPAGHRAIAAAGHAIIDLTGDIPPPAVKESWVGEF